MIRRLDLHNKRSGLFEGLDRKLFESDTRIKRTERIIEDNFSGILNLDGKVSGPDYYVNNNQDTTWRQYLLYNLRHTFGLMSNSDVPYLPGVATIAYRDCKFDKLDQDLDKITRLSKYVNLAKKEGKLITVDMTFGDLTKEYEPVLKREEEEENEKRKGLTLRHNERYKIIRIDDFKIARKYGKYTGGKNGKGRLCYATSESTWESYTRLGRNACYLCLRDDFESTEPVKTEGYPKDSYGLSMVWVFVDPNGDISNSNVRWNHGDHSYNNIDSMFTKMELEELLGCRFEDVFEPYDRSKKALEDAKRRLQNGERPEDIFDRIWDSIEGYAKVQLNGLWNFIGEDREFLSERWFDEVRDFSEGYAAVQLDYKWNFIGKDGEFLSEKWFEYVGDFSEGYVMVKEGWKSNFIDRDGKILSERWFDYAEKFSEGYARIQLNGKWNFIGKDGKILSERGFDYAENFSEGYAKVRLYGKKNFIGKDGELLSERWFDYAEKFSEGYAAICLNNKWNFIGEDGEFLSEEWFDTAKDFSEGYAAVCLNNKWNFVGKDGDFLFERWFDNAWYFSEGYAPVRLGSKCNFIGKDGDFLSEKWFDGLGCFRGGYAQVEINGNYFKIDKAGNISDL